MERLFFFFVVFSTLNGDRISTYLGDLKISVVEEVNISFLIFLQSLLNQGACYQTAFYFLKKTDTVLFPLESYLNNLYYSDCVLKNSTSPF